MPERYGHFRTICDRFARYRDDGTLDRILKALRLKLDAEGHIEWTTWMVDATHVRASRVASGARKRGAQAGQQRRRASSAGARTQPWRTDDQNPSGLRRTRPAAGGACHGRAAQRGRRVRGGLCARRGPAQTEASAGRPWLRRPPYPVVAASTSDQSRDPRATPASGQEASSAWSSTGVRRGAVPAARARPGRLVGWLKEHRSLATRFDKLASSFLAMVKLACIRRLLRAAFPHKL